MSIRHTLSAKALATADLSRYSFSFSFSAPQAIERLRCNRSNKLQVSSNKIPKPHPIAQISP
ncbi:MAG: hypothetical protein HOH58_09290 [Opitutaceae bacterium]|jgi:hypothetical protein|nr:hypothetical protein [Opitutaceae bacterium]